MHSKTLTILATLTVLMSSSVIAQPPKHPGAEKAMAKIVLEKDFGDHLKFHSRQVVTLAHNDKVPGLNGLMFMRWKGGDPGTEVMASVQWFEKKKDLLAFYDQSKKREDYKLGEFDGTEVWKIGEAGYSWTDGEHFLVSLGGSPTPPSEMVKAWLAMIASKVAKVEKEDKEKPASAGTVAIGSGAQPKGSLAQEKRDDSSHANVELSDFGEAVGDPGAIREVPPSGAQARRSRFLPLVRTITSLATTKNLPTIFSVIAISCRPSKV